MNAVGIDVSKGKSMMAALRPMGEVTLRPKEYPHTDVGLEQMADAIIALGEDTRVVMEATGRYHEPVAAALPEGFNELRRDIAGLCNNVNQIARAVHMNARDAFRAASDARRYAGEVYQMLTEWMNRGV